MMKNESTKTCVYCGTNVRNHSNICSTCWDKLKLVRTIKAMTSGRTYKEVRADANRKIKDGATIKRFTDRLLEKAWGQLSYFEIKTLINNTLEEMGIDKYE